MRNKITYSWVITREGPSHSTEVLGIISARNSDDKVKEYAEWLYALIYYGPEEHFSSFARYNNRKIPYEAEICKPYPDSTNPDLIHALIPTVMTCGHNPYLVARRARDVEFIDRNDGVKILEWREWDIRSFDARTREKKSERRGKVVESP